MAEQQHTSPIHDLPEEILEEVFKHLEPVSLAAAETVCTRWRKLLLSTSGELCWRNLVSSALSCHQNVVVDPSMKDEVTSIQYWKKVCALSARNPYTPPTTFEPSSEVVVDEETKLLTITENTQQNFARNRAIRGDLPFPSPRQQEPLPTPIHTTDGQTVVAMMNCAYFEIVMEGDDWQQRGNQCLAVGLATSEFPLHRQPGWTDNSFGYHSDDGNRFHGTGRGTRYDESFGKGDTVGCGLVWGSEPRVFYTRNGRFLGPAFGINTETAENDPQTEPPKFFAALGFSVLCPVRYNFGDKPFAFDLLARQWEVAADTTPRQRWVGRVRGEEEDEEEDEGSDEEGRQARRRFTMRVPSRFRRSKLETP